MVVLRDAQPGPRSTPTDAGTRAAMNQWAALDGAMARSNDEAVKLQRNITRRLAALQRELGSLAELVGAIARTLPQTEAPDIWCQVCAPRGHRHPHDARRIGGLVACQWAARWQQRNGRLPTRAEVERHAQGKQDRERVG